MPIFSHEIQKIPLNLTISNKLFNNLFYCFDRLLLILNRKHSLILPKILTNP